MSHEAATIAVAINVIAALEKGVKSTPSAIAALPKLAADLRAFGRADLAERIDVFVD